MSLKFRGIKHVYFRPREVNPQIFNDFCPDRPWRSCLECNAPSSHLNTLS